MYGVAAGGEGGEETADRGDGIFVHLSVEEMTGTDLGLRSVRCLVREVPLPPSATTRGVGGVEGGFCGGSFIFCVRS